MKEVCLCINKVDKNIHAVGIWNNENKQYYAESSFLWINVSDGDFEYKGISFYELNVIIKKGINCSYDKSEIIQQRKILKSFLEYVEADIDYLQCEPSVLIDGYFDKY